MNDPEVGNVEGVDQGEDVSGDDEPDDTFHDPTGIVDRDDPIEEGQEERVPVDEERLDLHEALEFTEISTYGPVGEFQDIGTRKEDPGNQGIDDQRNEGQVQIQQIDFR
ncbi:MAG: hypothetical protein ACREA0_15050, partial [bacterium]